MAGRSACKTSILTIHNGTLVGYRSIKNWWKYTCKIISFVNECVHGIREITHFENDYTQQKNHWITQ